MGGYAGSRVRTRSPKRGHTLGPGRRRPRRGASPVGAERGAAPKSAELGASAPRPGAASSPAAALAGRRRPLPAHWPAARRAPLPGRRPGNRRRDRRRSDCFRGQTFPAGLCAPSLVARFAPRVSRPVVATSQPSGPRNEVEKGRLRIELDSGRQSGPMIGALGPDRSFPSAAQLP